MTRNQILQTDNKVILLADSLREARRRTNMSGVRAAELLGLSAAAYRRYERGEVVPSAQTILQMADLFDCSPTALMLHGGEEPHHRNRRNIQQVDVNLSEGDAITITINAEVRTQPQVNNELDKPYKPAKITTNTPKKRIKKPA